MSLRAVRGLDFVFVVLAIAAARLASLWEDAGNRSYELERQNMSPEEGKYTWSEYEAMMWTIAGDNMADSRGYAATLAVFDSFFDAPPESVLEVGPGSGNFSRLLAGKYPNSTVLGIDASDFSIKVARSGEALPNLRFEHRSSAELAEPAKSFDVLTTTFVNHEIFPDTEFVDFLRRVRVVGRRAFVFNDYVRSFGCLASMSVMNMVTESLHMLPGVEAWLPGELGTRAAVFLTQPPSVQKLALDGGLQSLKRSFTISEYNALFREAGYPEGSLRCNREEGVYLQDFFGATCRIACVADLED